jgi:hypothetical protein
LIFAQGYPFPALAVRALNSRRGPEKSSEFRNSRCLGTL